MKKGMTPYSWAESLGLSMPVKTFGLTEPKEGSARSFQDRNAVITVSNPAYKSNEYLR